MFVEIQNRREGGLWWRVPLVLVIWAVLIAPLVGAYVLVTTVRGYTADLPAVPALDAWRATIPQTSVMVASDGSVLATIPFTDGEVIGHRRWMSARAMPRVLVDAILAAEDVRFFTHRGVDPQAVARAALANYRAGEIVEGASTITQQLVRNLLPEGIGDERSVRRKVREAVLAYRFEQSYSKEQILEAYINLVFLGAGSYGMMAAAERYFGKHPAELTLPEAAMIAGLAQAPGRADPTLDAVVAKERRNEVLERMATADMIAVEAARAAMATPIELVPPTIAYGTLAPWHTERARQQIEERYPDAYRRGGLLIETTAEPALSMVAESRSRARAERLTSHGKTPQVGALVWDYRTGYLSATVGGLSFDESKFDRAVQACRQPGSAFKPILYAAALEADAITPGTALRDGPIAEWDDDLGVHWKPQNSGRTFRGVAIAQDALASSLNAPAVDVLDRVGGKAVIGFARRLGLTTKMVDVRPLALGSSCVIPLELTAAFATFASGGARVEPLLVKQVRRDEHVEVDRAAPTDPMLEPARRLDRLTAAAAAPDTDRVVDAETAFLITAMMRDVVRRGTGTAARTIGRPAAGKTGTTNDNSDAWFVGFTARVVAAVWIGHDNPAIRLPRSADGARGALPLWVQLVRAAEGKRPPTELLRNPPSGLVRSRIDRETGMLAEPGAGGAIDLFFRAGTVPTQSSGTRSDLPSSLERATRDF